MRPVGAGQGGEGDGGGGEGRRGRKEYALTDEGLAELRHWLTETTPRWNTRSDILLRVFLLGVLTPEQAHYYLTDLIEMSDQGRRDLEKLTKSVDRDEDNLSVYGRIALEYGLRFNAMRREWARWAADRIAEQPTPPATPDGGAARGSRWRASVEHATTDRVPRSTRGHGSSPGRGRGIPRGCPPARDPTGPSPPPPAPEGRGPRVWTG
ncbi:hypothetical protein [Kitasatospora sp. NPDC059571]|uniref:hypothetical protein n=1 Tax=Kitasatospora sp. NPDC059571 TaxID=3346871 RepID=UPI00368805E6